MAAGCVDGRHDFFDRHAEPRDRVRAQRRRSWQLGLVGVRHHWDAHGLRVCQALAQVRRNDGRGILRATLQWQIGRLPAWVSRAVSRAGFQCPCDGRGVSGSGEIWRDRVRYTRLANAHDGWSSGVDLQFVGWIAWGDLDGFRPVYSRDGGVGLGGDPFGEPRESWRAEEITRRKGSRRETRHVAKPDRPSGVGTGASGAAGRPVVGILLPWIRTGRRWLHRAADVFCKKRAPRDGGDFVFNLAHYALRPWPWILIALVSIVIFPTVDSIKEAFPNADPNFINDDTAYPAMLTLLPNGLLGLVAASLIAAFMSTMSTQVNLGASYIVNDYYKRFLNPGASERQLVWAGRIATAVMIVMGCCLGLMLSDANKAFKIVLLLGAGTGGIYILRWFWWRINAVTEIVAMIVSLIVAVFFTFLYPEITSGVWANVWGMILPVILTTCAWIAATYLTQPTDKSKLREFYRRVQPGGPGWARVREEAERDGVRIDEGEGCWDVPLGILCTLLGCLTIYSAIFATGSWIYGKVGQASGLTLVTIVCGACLTHYWSRFHTKKGTAPVQKSEDTAGKGD